MPRTQWPTIEYSLDKLSMPVPLSGCWLWMGKINMQGYGMLSRYPNGKQKTLRAHVESYKRHVGPIPAGLELDHLCRVRHCINPAHLEAVTHQVNSQRGLAGAYLKNKTHCIRGHALSGDNCEINSKGHRRCRACTRLGYHRRKQCKR